MEIKGIIKEDGLDDDAKKLLKKVGQLPKPSISGNTFRKKFRKNVKKHLHRHPEVLESNGEGVEYVKEVFENWGLTVVNVPAYTFIPKTKTGVCNIVKWAKNQNKKVRTAGYRHSWGEIFSTNGDVLVSLLPIDVVQELPTQHPGIERGRELQGINFIKTIEENGSTKALYKIGSGTTNEQFRRWAVEGNEWTLPLNVIMVEITFGGSNAPICHGAGIHTQTLSDLVYEIEFVNAKGELQTVNDPEQLKAAAGCFGLLGIVTAITFKLDPMTYANMKPEKKRLALTIPPPKGMELPLQIDMSGLKKKDFEEAWGKFVSSCENDYYAEWFWFPNRKRCWINTWKNDGKKEDARDYPKYWEVKFQELQTFLGQLLNDYFFKWVSVTGKSQANLLAMAAMIFLPAKKTIVTHLINALHFRRGIQNMRVCDIEMEIPIPASKDDPNKPDWTVCQKAWWAVINDFYIRTNTPMRMTLEMRVMGGSNIAMAPQYGNKFGTCSIEVLSTINDTDKEKVEWEAYKQDIINAWSKITAHDGAPLNMRPHWAKEWQGLKINERPIIEYLKKTAYKKQIPIFKNGLQKVANEGQYTLTDCRNMFSNPLLDDIFEEVFN